MRNPCRMRTICKNAPPVDSAGGVPLFAFVFSFGGDAASDMAFVFVMLENLTYLLVQNRIILL